jgi:hypothetical protein
MESGKWRRASGSGGRNEERASMEARADAVVSVGVRETQLQEVGTVERRNRGKGREVTASLQPSQPRFNPFLRDGNAVSIRQESRGDQKRTTPSARKPLLCYHPVPPVDNPSTARVMHLFRPHLAQRDAIELDITSPDVAGEGGEEGPNVDFDTAGKGGMKKKRTRVRLQETAHTESVAKEGDEGVETTSQILRTGVDAG